MTDSQTNPVPQQGTVFPAAGIRSKITFMERMKLLFRPGQFAIEGKTVVRYKRIGDVICVLEVKHYE